MGEVFQSQHRHRRSDSSIGVVGDGYMPNLSIDTNVMHHRRASVSSSGARGGMDVRSVSQVCYGFVCLFFFVCQTIQN